MLHTTPLHQKKTYPFAEKYKWNVTHNSPTPKKLTLLLKNINGMLHTTPLHQKTYPFAKKYKWNVKHNSPTPKNLPFC